jgi:ABC-type Mn2+/Zn2+ transport system ATPase subunit
LAGDQGIVIGGKLFADSLGDEESGAGTYTSMLKQNTDLIVQGLTRTGEGRSEEQKTDFNSLAIILFLLLIAFGTVWWLLKAKSSEEIAWKDFDLEIHGLSVSYDKKTALSNVYLKIDSGHVIGLIGSNGSGKSTLMKSILGLVEPDAGEILINGRDVNDIRKYIAYIPQKEEIDFSFPATVFDVVMMGRYPHRNVFESLKQNDKQKAVESMKILGIDNLSHKQIGELSGGQQQRAFIARALCQGAEIYLFDEPFVGVDVTTEKRIMEIVRELAQQGKMVIIIHHDLAKVQEYFDQLVMINQRIVTTGPTAEVFTDENIAKTYGGQLAMLHKTAAPRK